MIDFMLGFVLGIGITMLLWVAAFGTWRTEE